MRILTRHIEIHPKETHELNINIASACNTAYTVVSTKEFIVGKRNIRQRFLSTKLIDGRAPVEVDFPVQFHGLWQAAKQVH